MKNWNTCVAAAAAFAVAAGLSQAVEVSAPAEPMSVWFNKPAKSFHESCVLGNGRLGAMDFGGVAKERIVLNESSVWSGGPYDGNKYDACKCLPEVRENYSRAIFPLPAASSAIVSVTPTRSADGGISTNSAVTRRWAT